MSGNSHGQGSPSDKNPDAKTASQWLTDALNEAAHHTNDHGHVDFLKQKQSAGKITIDLS